MSDRTIQGFTKGGCINDISTPFLCHLIPKNTISTRFFHPKSLKALKNVEETFCTPFIRYRCSRNLLNEL